MTRVISAVRLTVSRDFGWADAGGPVGSRRLAECSRPADWSRPDQGSQLSQVFDQKIAAFFRLFDGV